MEARTTGKREFYANYKMCSAWRFLYKRSMVVANGILFPAIGEDTMFNCEFLFYAKSAFVMDNILYTYYVKESVALLSSLKKTSTLAANKIGGAEERSRLWRLYKEKYGLDIFPMYAGALFLFGS